jgi:hypothetical protein
MTSHGEGGGEIPGRRRARCQRDGRPAAREAWRRIPSESAAEAQGRQGSEAGGAMGADRPASRWQPAGKEGRGGCAGRGASRDGVAEVLLLVVVAMSTGTNSIDGLRMYMV